MNRSLPALILLLGTLGGSIVALGVARDLERVGRRVPVETRPDSTLHDVSFGRTHTTPEVTIRSGSLNERPLTVRAFQDFQVKWKLAAKTTRYAVDALARHAVRVELSSLEWLEAAEACDTAAMDHFIASNDGIEERAERDYVPFGYLAIGPERKRIALQYRGETGSDPFTWSGSLHYGGTPRRTLSSTVAVTTPTTQKTQPLPWDKLMLWSSDRRELTGRWNRWASFWVKSSLAAIESLGIAGEGLAWAEGQIDRSWEALARHAKRELWLAMVPQLPRTLRSAELPQGGKR